MHVIIKTLILSLLKGVAYCFPSGQCDPTQGEKNNARCITYCGQYSRSTYCWPNMAQCGCRCDGDVLYQYEPCPPPTPEFNWNIVGYIFVGIVALICFCCICVWRCKKKKRELTNSNVLRAGRSFGFCRYNKRNSESWINTNSRNTIPCTKSIPPSTIGSHYTNDVIENNGAPSVLYNDLQTIAENYAYPTPEECNPHKPPPDCNPHELPPTAPTPEYDHVFSMQNYKSLLDET